MWQINKNKFTNPCFIAMFCNRDIRYQICLCCVRLVHELGNMNLNSKQQEQKPSVQETTWFDSPVYLNPSGAYIRL